MTKGGVDRALSKRPQIKTINDSCHVPLALSTGTCISLPTTEEVVDRVGVRRVNENLRFWGVNSGDTKLASSNRVSVWGILWFVERTGVRGSSITYCSLATRT